MTMQPFHIVDNSPWPITGSIAAFSTMIGLINLMHLNNTNILILSFSIMILTMIQWWRDICRESTFQGHHTMIVAKNMKWGMILFIISEIFFFISFFWAFFHSSLSPNIEIGAQWPPEEIFPFNPFSIPLLNTTILLSSGISITWAHHNLITKIYNETVLALTTTIVLGLVFTMLQSWEYIQAPFSISDSIYGTTFFVSTGFHGLHVIIGTSFLMVTLTRILMSHMTNNHHVGFEAAAWYWHFVDVVWLFLYTFIYWWAF
uniref:Cytochrome c oxidase subunit 3 n=1 Tax=Ornithodoros waterbergensis TaxID=1580575 RepID=A0A1P8AGC6_9ACAR|nr:cytochrome c oxidase subunit III [Ornithodoros waterbergensis]AIZ58598.1 cytochrome c oxidase subunit III [Ornithodoros waterbergensis]AMX74161.1 cytochrome c oxidase subunit III [Ornithodoros waterbergensis]UYL27163.1 cytochrome c oxidase subunit III [Ornithodoros waterbergensis]